jgi:hypothetical protein
MSAEDPLAACWHAWRSNPFFVLELSPQASRAEVERAGQKLLGLLALGSASAGSYDTPFGPATRDADIVRQAVATLRDPTERVMHELLADLPRNGGAAQADPRAAWPAVGRAIGWTGKWPA